MRSSRLAALGMGCVLVAGAAPGATAAAGSRDGRADATKPGSVVGSAATGRPRPAKGRAPRRAPHPVRSPRFVRNIDTGETGWFASPGLVDLNGDGRLEIVAPFYSTFVFDAKGHQLARRTATKGRVYAPSVVTDLEGDGVPDIVVGGTGSV